MKLSAISIISTLLCTGVSGTQPALRVRDVEVDTAGNHFAGNLRIKLGVPSGKQPDARDLAVLETTLMKSYNQVYKGTDFSMADAHVDTVSPGIDAELSNLEWGKRGYFDILARMDIVCTLCPDDDDAYMSDSGLFGTHSAAVARLKTVEKLMCLGLAKESNDPYYNQVHDCSITVESDVDTTSEDLIVGDFGWKAQDFGTYLMVSFPGLSPEKPDVRDLSIAEASLMRAYNAVYKGTDFDMFDTRVTTLGPDEKEAELFELKGRRRHSDWMFHTSVGCNLCGRDDDDALTEVGGHSAALGKLDLVAKLMCRIAAASNDEYFEHVHDCTITVNTGDFDDIEVDAMMA